MARQLIASLGLAVAAGSCAAAQPPPELSGLWSAGDAACAAGVGVRFREGAIEAVYDRETEVLFEHPHYEVLPDDERFRVRITYKLPELAGGAHSVGARGVLVLAQQPDGGVAPESHQMVDARTGAARIRIQDDAAQALMTLEPCDGRPSRQGLRGLSSN